MDVAWFDEFMDLTPELIAFLNSRPEVRNGNQKWQLAQGRGDKRLRALEKALLAAKYGFDFGGDPGRSVKSLVCKTPESIAVTDLPDHSKESFCEAYQNVVIPF